MSTLAAPRRIPLAVPIAIAAAWAIAIAAEAGGAASALHHDELLEGGPPGWGAFGLAAFAGDALLHEAVHAVPVLEARPWLIGGGVLVLAGAFQFTALKEACLDQCRHPGVFLMRRYRRGAGAAFRLGRDHGVFCLGCCWALMLLMFAAGFANLAWMAGLATLTAYEKVGRSGPLVARVAGVVLLSGGALVLADGLRA